jgi:hypothetical protein
LRTAQVQGLQQRRRPINAVFLSAPPQALPCLFIYIFLYLSLAINLWHQLAWTTLQYAPISVTLFWLWVHWF